jgi:hypothetical protein
MIGIMKTAPSDKIRERFYLRAALPGCQPERRIRCRGMRGKKEQDPFLTEYHYVALCRAITRSAKSHAERFKKDDQTHGFKNYSPALFEELRLTEEASQRALHFNLKNRVAS